MKIKITFYISILITAICFSQPEIEWQKSFGGSNEDRAHSIKQTLDGGYIVAGYSRSSDGDVSNNLGTKDFWILKFSSENNLEWEKSIGGTFGEEANSIMQTSDGGYFVGGHSQSIDGDVTGNHGAFDYWAVKLTDIGEIEWQKSLGGSENEVINDVKQTTEGGFIVAGYSRSVDGDITNNHGASDLWVIKLTASGIIEWQKSLGGSSPDGARSLSTTIDGGYILTGYSSSIDGDVTTNNGDSDIWVIKLNSVGSIEWQKSYGGSEIDFANSIKQTIDGGYIVGGYTGSNDGDVTGFHGEVDFWVIKISEDGTLEWQKTLGGSDLDTASEVIQTNDGSFVVVGRSESNDGDVSANNGSIDFWVVKLSSTGELIWEKSIGGSQSDRAYSVQQDTEGDYIIVGYSESNDGDVTNNQGDDDVWIVKLTEVLGVEGNKFNTTLLYPNPTNGMVTIETEYLSEIKIYDSLGKLSFSQKMENENITTIDVSHLSKGVYTLVILNEKGKLVKKLVVK